MTDVLRQLADLAAILPTFAATDWSQAVGFVCERSLAITGAKGVAFWEIRDDAMVLSGTAGIARSFGAALLRPIPSWLTEGGALVARDGEAAARYAELCRPGRKFGSVIDVAVPGDGSRSGALWFVSPSRLGDAAHPVALLLADQLRHAIARQTSCRTISQAISQADALRRVTTSIIAARDPSDVLSSVASEAQALLRSDVVLIALFVDGGRSVRILCRGNVPDGLDGVEFRIRATGSVRAARAAVARRLREVGLVAIRTQEIQGDHGRLGLLAVGRALGPALPADGEPMLRAFAAHATVAVRIACLLTQLSAQQRELSRLAQHQFTVEEEQRRRIALELHDEVGQSLTGILIGARRMAARSACPEIATDCGELAGEIEQVISSLRAISYRLRPPMLEALGLGASIEWLARSSMRHADATIEVEAKLSTRSARTFDTCLYRIAQEGLTNSLRHGGAEHIVISLQEDPDQIALSITDNGRGFDPRQIRPGESCGLGLLGIRERAAAMGGTLDIWSEPGSGTKLSVRVPLTRTYVDATQSIAG